MDNIFVSIGVVSFLLMIVALAWPKTAKPKQQQTKQRIEPQLPPAVRVNRSRQNDLSPSEARQLFRNLRDR